MNPLPIARDIFERVAATFGVVLLTFLTSDLVNWQDVLRLDNWKGWATAALAAAFTTLKAALATRVGKWRGRAASASLDPGVKLAPVAGPGVAE
jgi:hypothetical protein